MGHEVLKKFDRYFLLDCIAQGGMAEIFRARLAASDGAGRLLVIKRILAGYGKNIDFRKMFQSEIKVMLGFNHPSIVQLYDFGEHQGQPFIAMELVDGRNLRQLLTRLSKSGQKMPVEYVVAVAMEVASGLHYAHVFKDKISGDSLNIVHRDVSPQNILISYDGNIKIIDFGIAKARTNVDSTRVGIIKGKPSYLSPEQIHSSGDSLDGRSDVFSLGAVAWEMLTGKKLFAAQKGENEFAVLKLIESCDSYVKPPSTLNPSVPKELDEIIMKSLTKKREDRYQTADEFHRALRKFLYTAVPDFSPADLANYIKGVFKEEIVEDRKLIQKLNGKAEQLLKSEYTNITSSLQAFTLDHPTEGAVKESSTAVDPIKDLKENSGSFNRMDKRGDSGSKSMPGVDIDSGIVGAQQAAKDERAEEDRRQKRVLSMKTRAQKQRSASSYNDRESAGAWGARIVSGIGAVFIVLVVFGPDWFNFSPSWVVDLRGRLGFPKSSDRKIAGNPEVIVPPPVTLTGPSVDLSVTLMPPGRTDNNTRIRLKVEGQEAVTLPVANPLFRIPLNTPIELTVESEGFRSVARQFSVDAARLGPNQKQVVQEIRLEQLVFGYLTITSTPSAKVTLRAVDDPNPREPASVFYTPDSNRRLPTGQYIIQLQNDLLGLEKTLKVEIEESKTKRIDVVLKPN